MSAEDGLALNSRSWPRPLSAVLGVAASHVWTRIKATLNRDKAMRLNEAWGVGAAQVRYSDDGHWYAKLARFPAALFDAHCFVLFMTEERRVQYLAAHQRP